MGTWKGSPLGRLVTAATISCSLRSSFLPGSRPNMMTEPGEGVLAFEKPGGGADLVEAWKVAQVLHEGKVPVVVLNACQSGAVGKALEGVTSQRLPQRVRDYVGSQTNVALEGSAAQPPALDSLG